ncbi:MAG: hypothetical protein ACXWM7_01315 [Parachlamydiaceae bacterium]
MSWHTIDFQGMTSFEKTLVEQLRNYLNEKQSFYSHLISESIPTEHNAGSPILTSSKAHKLSDGVETFTRKVNQAIVSSTTSQTQLQYSSQHINRILWDYAELLQGIEIELFQQLEQVGIDQWRPQLIEVVEDIKDILLHHIDDLKWAIKRLETQLWEYQCRQTKQNQYLSKLLQALSFKKGIIDPSIVKSLEKNQNFLNVQYRNFQQRYEKYTQLDAQVEKKMGKFQSYQTLKSLESEEQQNFKRLYRLLKLWKLNQQAKALPPDELIRALRYTIHPEKAAGLFKRYSQALQKKLFEKGREIKQLRISAHDEDGDDTLYTLELQSILSGQRLELHTLSATVSAYHTFLLQSDPNPYVRTRGGFSEWLVGREPSQTKPLITQEYDIARLDSLYAQFLDSLKFQGEKPVVDWHLYQKIDHALHELGQPLASIKTMKAKAEYLTELINQLHEISSRDPNVVRRVTPILSKAMRADWKYNVLHELPLFHQLYSIHMHLVPPISDRSHLERLKHFKTLLEQLTSWVKEKNTLSHSHDIELDINDIKIYLQEFLAQLQRTTKNSNLFTKEKGDQLLDHAAQKLLEYRYLFGEFFHELKQSDMEERMLRNQFLFVDYYFETIEQKLIDSREELIQLKLSDSC